MEDIAIHHLLFEWIISLHMEDTQNKIIFLGINQNFEEKHAVAADLHVELITKAS
jgi:hypothetical protein